VAAVTALGIVQGFDRVNGDKVAAVAFRHIISLVIPGAQVRVDAAAGMAVETERLLVALGAVAPGLAGHQPVPANPISVMVGRNTLSLVALAAFGDLHFGVVFMGLFRGLAC